MAWLAFRVLIHQLLPLGEGPYELGEITEALIDAYGEERVNYNKVAYAYRTLHESPHTSKIVEPLNPGETPLLFSSQAAWRIARRLLRGELPANLAGAPSPKVQKSPPKPKVSRRIKAE